MSYIHEALKKAQKEKESLSARCAAIWPPKKNGQFFFDRNRSISVGIVLIAVAFSAFSWLQSIDSLPTDSDTDPASYRGAVNLPAAVPSTRPPKPARIGPTENANTIRSPAPEIKADRKPPKQIQVAEMEKQSTMSTIPEALPESPLESGSGLYQQALARQRQGQLQEAVTLYKSVLERSPNLVSALNNLGTIYIQQKNLPEARKVLERAIRLDASYVDPYYNLACLHAQQKDIGRSLFYLKKAISVDEAARQWARTDEDLRNLRGHVEYEKIIKGAQDS